MEDMR
jgi:hypothetical protein